MPLATPSGGPTAVRAVVAGRPVDAALARLLAGRNADPALAGFYRARGYAPLWVEGGRITPAAHLAVAALKAARTDGLDPARYRTQALQTSLARAASGGPGAQARAELALSEALSAYGADLRSPRPGAEFVFPDPALPSPPGDRLSVLRAAAAGSTPAARIAAVLRMNPLYEGLRAALAEELRSGAPSPGRLAALRANLERLRQLPPDLGRRFVLVDVAAQHLWFYEDGRAVGGMEVIVGKPSQPTPMMAGLIRYAVVRPYWNVPPDLVRDNLAPRVLGRGVAHFTAEDMEALSDWTDAARVLAPEAVDWAGVAAGRTELRVRQRPGPDNMMGRVKFMFPNRLGVYLHDTPRKALFAHAPRAFSSGCVRLENAERLARWLLGDEAARLRQNGPPEQRAPLAEPAPVYLVYMTLAPTTRGVLARPDIYGLDTAPDARLAAVSSPG